MRDDIFNFHYVDRRIIEDPKVLIVDCGRRDFDAVGIFQPEQHPDNFRAVVMLSPGHPAETE